MVHPRGSCHCAPVPAQGRGVVKPHAVIHNLMGFGERCLRTEGSSWLLLWALQGLCRGHAELEAPEGRSPES